ncbi:hypothetical protein ECPV1252_50550 [Escherichia coli]
MEIKPEDELSNIVLFPVKEDDPRNQVNFLYEPSERPYCHHASVRVDEKERQVRCKICGAVVEPFDWMLSVAKRETRLADDVRLLRQSSRETLRQLDAKTGATRYLMSVLARELVASGDVYNSGYGLFPSEQARKDWQNARKKLSRAKVKKPVVVDPDLIWSLPDGEIRRYDRRQNIICRECRKSEVMQRVLIFCTGVMIVQ